MESYLDHVTIVKHRVALTRLRVSCHNLEIEVGCYHRPRVTPLHQRVCRICQVLEDEMHFVCVCPRFSSLRVELFSSVTVYYPSFALLSITDQFIYLLKSKIPYIERALSKLIFK